MDFIRARLKEAIRRERITQRAFSRRMGHSDAWISDVLNGKQGVTLDTLDRLITELGLTPVTFFAPEKKDGGPDLLVSGVDPQSAHSANQEGADASTSDPRLLVAQIPAILKRLEHLEHHAGAGVKADLEERTRKHSPPTHKPASPGSHRGKGRS